MNVVGTMSLSKFFDNKMIKTFFFVIFFIYSLLSNLVKTRSGKVVAPPFSKKFKKSSKWSQGNASGNQPKAIKTYL